MSPRHDTNDATTTRTAEPTEFPRIVSVDDHVVEPPTLWTDRLSGKDAERGPHVVREKVPSRDGREERWCDVWIYEDERFPTMRTTSAVGFPPEDVEVVPVTFEELRPGSYQREHRLADMDANATDASLCFPNLFVRFCGQRFFEADDRELAGKCVRAYNDWLLEEWCAPSGSRLFGAAIVPLWDAGEAAAEVRRNAARGCRAVCFSEIPPWLGLPSIYTGAWDPLFDACEETDTLLCMHIGSSSGRMLSSDDAPAAVTVINNYGMSSLSLSDWLMSGLFDRFPRLEVLYAESQAGWMPYVMERLDNMWEEGKAFNGTAALPRPPSSYFHGHVFASIFDDPVAIRELDVIGADSLCFETDYPHADSTWPKSLAVARENFGHLEPDVTYKIIRGNGRRLLRMDPDPVLTGN